jgi:hypothetical protein
MAQSQYAAREWQSFCDTVTQVRALENVSHTKRPVHDDLELCELSAQRNLHRDWKSALEVTLRCVHSLGADAAHRVKAAITALKLATNIGDLETMDTVFNEVAPLTFSDRVGIADRLALSMIYHTIRGDASTSAAAARELLALTERTLPPQHQLASLIDCAGALRRTGLAGEAEVVYEAVFRMSVSLQAFDFSADACHRLIEIYSESGDLAHAASWVSRYQQLRRPKAELRSQRNLRLAIARVYLAQQRWRDAAGLIDTPKANPLWKDAVTMFRSGALAMKIRLEIGRQTSPSDVAKWVAELAPLNACLRATGAQDYETYSLYLGYRYTGQTEAAGSFLTVYAEHERRDVAPLSPEISRELERLSATPVTPNGVLGLPACAGATDETST